MRSALTVFRAAIPRKLTTSLSQEMRWAAHELDHARDIDVYISDNFRESGDRSRCGEKKMRKVAMKDRKQTYDRLRALIKGKRFTALEKHFAQWLDARGWRKGLSVQEKKALEGRIRPFAAQVLEQHRIQVLKDGRNICKLDSDALHQLRIDCKKLRYATEFFSPLYGKSMTGFTLHLKGLQDLLGTLHDTAVMTGLQQELLKGHGSARIQGFAGKLEGQRAREAKRLMKTLEARWHEFARCKRPWKASPA
jgi:CHAD domain-containing protein